MLSELTGCGGDRRLRGGLVIGDRPAFAAGVPASIGTVHFSVFPVVVMWFQGRVRATTTERGEDLKGGPRVAH